MQHRKMHVISSQHSILSISCVPMGCCSVLRVSESDLPTWLPARQCSPSSHNMCMAPAAAAGILLCVPSMESMSHTSAALLCHCQRAKLRAKPSLVLAAESTRFSRESPLQRKAEASGKTQPREDVSTAVNAACVLTHCWRLQPTC